MLEDQVEGHPHRNKPNCMSDSEIMVILILFYSSGISFVDSTPLRVCRNQRIHIHKTFEGYPTNGKSNGIADTLTEDGFVSVGVKLYEYG